ncbi:glycogen/starch/alpha-glucan phosphorylase, partial [Hungatella hathewayi]
MEQELNKVLGERFGKTIEEACMEEIYHALLTIVKGKMKDLTPNTGSRKLYYISAEFLIGKLLSNNLINLGLFDETAEVLKKHGIDIADIEEAELEPSLGNGGLGRLAACFLDSIATLKLPGDGVGLNYHDGLFKQTFADHKQREEKNPWMTGDDWLTRTDVHFEVPFKDLTVTSTMYDIDVPGYEGGKNSLHLFDLDSVDESIIHDGIEFDKEDIRRGLTLFLYPDDSDEKGQLLRIYQQYFMVSNAAQLILKETEERG